MMDLRLSNQKLEVVLAQIHEAAEDAAKRAKERPVAICFGGAVYMLAGTSPDQQVEIINCVAAKHTRLMPPLPLGAETACRAEPVEKR